MVIDACRRTRRKFCPARPTRTITSRIRVVRLHQCGTVSTVPTRRPLARPRLAACRCRHWDWCLYRVCGSICRLVQFLARPSSVASHSATRLHVCRNLRVRRDDVELYGGGDPTKTVAVLSPGIDLRGILLRGHAIAPAPTGPLSMFRT